MSNYITTYNTVIKNEGGYAFPFGDSGETYKGIDRKWHPNWPGWKIIDAYKATHQLKQYDVIPNVDLENWVAAFYKDYLSRHVNIESISNQVLSDMVADFLIHKQYDAIKVINAVALIVASAIRSTVIVNKESDKISASVLFMMNAAPAVFYVYLKDARKKYYSNPAMYGSSLKFSAALVSSFLNRVNSFPQTA